MRQESLIWVIQIHCPGGFSGLDADATIDSSSDKNGASKHTIWVAPTGLSMNRCEEKYRGYL